MVSLPSGFDSRLEIHTDCISIVLKRKDPSALLDPENLPGQKTLIEVLGERLKSFRIGPRDMMAESNCGDTHCVRVLIPPIFFGHTDYALLVRSKKGKRISLWHDDPLIREQICSVTDGSHGMIAATVNFGNCSGISEFELSHDGQKELTLRIEVLGTVGCDGDRLTDMMRDLLGESHSPLTDLLHLSGECPRTDNDTALLSFDPWLETHFDRYVKTLDSVLALPCDAHVAEYRFAKHLLHSVTDQLRKLREGLDGIALGSNYSASDKVANMISRLEQYASMSALVELEVCQTAPSEPLPSECREMCISGMLLMRVLPYWNGVLSVTDSQGMYSYWCFYKMLSILKKRGYDLYMSVEDDPLEVFSLEQTFTVDIKEHGALAGRFTVCTCEGMRLIVLGKGDDCKKLFLPMYNGFDDAACKEKMISALRSFRNGIMYGTRNGTRCELSAYILLPQSDTRGFSDDEDRIAALSFMPEATDAVEEQLSCIAVYPHLPADLAHELAATDFSVRDVLVGSVGSIEQFRDNLARKYYYVPERNLDLTKLPIRYVALYQSLYLFDEESGIRYYGEVTYSRRVRRREIRFPMRRNNGDEWYHAFRVSEWKLLPKVISATQEGVYAPKYTNLFLLTHCPNTYELFAVHSDLHYCLAYALNTLQPEGEERIQNGICRINENRILRVDKGWVEILDNNEDAISDLKIFFTHYSERPRMWFYKLLKILDEETDDETQ